MSFYCKQPDRDAPRMRCGYPLPCPWHTATIDVAVQTVTVPSHGDPLAVMRLREIGRILGGESVAPPRKKPKRKRA